MTAFNLFKKDSDKKPKAKVSTPKTVVDEQATESSQESGSNISVPVGGVLRGFYISEKSSLGNSFSQYSFLVAKTANKSEIKKEVSRAYNVKVLKVKIINTAEKRRDLGRHPGTKPGFKKAIVVLEKGQTIGGAKA